MIEGVSMMKEVYNYMKEVSNYMKVMMMWWSRHLRDNIGESTKEKPKTVWSVCGEKYDVWFVPLGFSPRILCSPLHNKSRSALKAAAPTCWCKFSKGWTGGRGDQPEMLSSFSASSSKGSVWSSWSSWSWRSSTWHHNHCKNLRTRHY